MSFDHLNNHPVIRSQDVHALKDHSAAVLDRRRTEGRRTELDIISRSVISIQQERRGASRTFDCVDLVRSSNQLDLHAVKRDRRQRKRDCNINEISEDITTLQCSGGLVITGDRIANV